MSGILQVEGREFSHNVLSLRQYMEHAIVLLTTVRQAEDHQFIDWEMLRDGIDSRFNVVFDNLQLDYEDEDSVDVEQDVMDGEEIDTTLHPLDPENDPDFYDDEA